MNDAQTRVQLCTECGTRSPKSATDYTLISSRYGWRLARQRNADGNIFVEWFCPSCWGKRRAR